MNGIGWRGLASVLALAAAAATGLYAGRALAPHAAAEDAPIQAQDAQAQAAAPQDVQPAPAQQATIPPQASPNPTPAPGSAQERDSAHLASILAPVALYPDPLLNNILAASTYPLEVVEADRWLDNPANAALRGDQLESALQQKDWDPAVKSLVPFPAILKMMDNQLDWTQQLGDAFLAQQDQVMDMVQQLRRQAEAAGGLVSTPQQSVSTDDRGAVAIQPANPQEVSVPAYNPNTVYGDWPYPAAPPDAVAAYGPDVADLGYGDGWYFGPPVVILTPIWFWGHLDWHRHCIDIDHDRFARLDPPHRFTVPTEWQHDPAHRHGVAYRAPGLQERFHPERIAVAHPAPAIEPSRSFAPPTQGGFAATRPAVSQEPPRFTPVPSGRFPQPAAAPQPVPSIAHPMTAPAPQPAPAIMHPMPAPQPRPVPPIAHPVPTPQPQPQPVPTVAHPMPAPPAPHPAVPAAPTHAATAPGGALHGGFQR